MGRLSSVISNGYAVNYTYFANGNRKDITYPNGAKEVYTYDKNNQVTLLENKKSDGSMLQSYSYTYDKSGNQLTKTENKGTTLYVYDGLNRLKSVTEPSGKRIAYTYDKAGNRKTESTTIGNVTTLTTYTYNSQNRLVTTETTSPLGTERIAYLYDANGNMTSKTKSTITQRPSVGASLPSFELVIKGLAPDKDVTFYNYNNRNQLNQVAEGTNVSSYSYNTDGLRTEKKVNDVVTKYLYESDKVVAEADASNLIIARNYYGTNLLARQVENDVLFYMYNAHGDVTTLINGVGTVVATYDYDAFGTIIEESGITVTAETGNLAVGKIAVSSSDESTNLISTKSIDGNVATRWSSNESDNEWLYVDLGSAFDINKVILKWETAYGKEYKIQVSDNAVDWTDVYYTNSENGGLDEITFSKISARYVRMLGIKRGTVWGYSLYEFQVFGIQIIEENTNNPYRYAGYQYDEESDLYYLNARYYDSKIARFMSEDTYRGQKNDPLSLNLYSYVSNNPVRYFDPTGHMQKGDDYYSADVQKQLAEYTQKYYDAKDDDTRRIIAIQAKNLRDSSELQLKPHGIPITNAFLDALEQSKYSDYDGKKYVIGDDWNRLSNDLSGNTYVNDGNIKEDKIEDITSSTKSTDDVFGNYSFDALPDPGKQKVELDNYASIFTFTFLLDNIYSRDLNFHSFILKNYSSSDTNNVLKALNALDILINIKDIKSQDEFIQYFLQSEIEKVSPSFKAFSDNLIFAKSPDIAGLLILATGFKELYTDNEKIKSLKMREALNDNIFNIFLLDKLNRNYFKQNQLKMKDDISHMFLSVFGKGYNENCQYLAMKSFELIDEVVELNDNYSQVIENLKSKFDKVEKKYWKDKYNSSDYRYIIEPPIY